MKKLDEHWIKRVVRRENKSLGNIKQAFISSNLRGQQHKSYSPSQVSGSISLGFYRGKQQGVYDAYLFLRKRFPKAAKELFDGMIYETERER